MSDGQPSLALLDERQAARVAGPAGAAAAVTLSAATDRWLAAIADDAFGSSDDVALVAVGGYGRGELAPFSDLDLLLVHRLRRGIAEIADRVWYPIWNAGVALGHGVLTLKEARQLAADDLTPATAYLSARLIHGSGRLADDLRATAAESWVKGRRRWLSALESATLERLDTVGELAFLLEPDLKNSIGGLRDIHTVGWLEQLGAEVDADDQRALDATRDVLLSARIALHRQAGRAGDVLRLDDQDAVARLTGYDDADQLMGAVSAAARTVAWVAEGVWGRLRPIRVERISPDRPLAPGIVIHNDEVTLSRGADPARDPAVLLRVLRASADSGAPIERATLQRLANDVPVFPSPWPAGALDDFVALLLEGHRAIPVMEAADQLGLWVRVLPEWASVRNRVQRNAYHRFTVDRHLWEATANAAHLAGRVARPDLLVLGALLHDIGKGLPGDHTDNGVALTAQIGPRIGLSAPDTDVVIDLVRHHLLLPDIATRRDLSDDATITAVAESVGSVPTLELLWALTEADSIATGTSAWGTWKAELVALLVDKTAHVLGGGDVRDVTWRPFPSDEVLALMAAGEVHVAVDDDRLTTVAPDRPGLFSRVAGVLSLNGLDVLGAEAHSDPAVGDGPAMAANEFRIVVPRHGVPWDRVLVDLRRALDGQLAIEARLAERARTYRRRRAQTAGVGEPQVRLDNDASSNATVVEVRAPNGVGTLYRMTKALAELGLDIRHAKVQTLGPDVVDSFYVQTASGTKLTDAFHQRELERALLHAVA